MVRFFLQLSHFYDSHFYIVLLVEQFLKRFENLRLEEKNHFNDLFIFAAIKRGKSRKNEDLLTYFIEMLWCTLMRSST